MVKIADGKLIKLRQEFLGDSYYYESIIDINAIERIELLNRWSNTYRVYGKNIRVKLYYDKDKTKPVELVDEYDTNFKDGYDNNYIPFKSRINTAYIELDGYFSTTKEIIDKLVELTDLDVEIKN